MTGHDVDWDKLNAAVDRLVAWAQAVIERIKAAEAAQRAAGRHDVADMLSLQIAEFETLIAMHDSVDEVDPDEMVAVLNAVGPATRQ